MIAVRGVGSGIGSGIGSTAVAAYRMTRMRNLRTARAATWSDR
jgi:hypothetical protein